jgi:hypothetical protein
MLTFDLHYHANVHQMPGMQRRVRLRNIAQTVSAHGLDYLASTEHCYKKPLEAYLHLADALSAGSTVVIPGMESVTSEGIDIIYLFRDEEQLRHAVEEVPSFRRSVRDVKSIADATGAVVSIPHPFHICRSAAGNVLCRRAYAKLLRASDYVEIHNGSALTFDKRLSASCTRPLFKKTMSRLQRTIDLPMRDRGRGLGWAVGSDAHYPGEQYIVGRTDAVMYPHEDAFAFLQRRIRFSPYVLRQPATENSINNYRLLRSLQSTFKEGARKEYIKARARAMVMAAAVLRIGVYPPS